MERKKPVTKQRQKSITTWQNIQKEQKPLGGIAVWFKARDWSLPIRKATSAKSVAGIRAFHQGIMELRQNADVPTKPTDCGKHFVFKEDKVPWLLERPWPGFPEGQQGRWRTTGGPAGSGRWGSVPSCRPETRRWTTVFQTRTTQKDENFGG